MTVEPSDADKLSLLAGVFGVMTVTQGIFGENVCEQNFCVVGEWRL